VYLSAGAFNESTVEISNVPSLVISGVPSATVFDCSRRLATTGAALRIVNSKVTITGVTFQSCSNPTSNGGAVSASGSSVEVSQCSFINCSAASGGAMSATGPGAGLFLNVESSTFARNSANGGLSSCPADAAQPCSTWGGAIATFDMLNVSITGSTMIENSAQAFVPNDSPQFGTSKSAVAGGGCVAVLFVGNVSGSSVVVSGSTFLQCAVAVAVGNNVNVGNGMHKVLRLCCCELCAFGVFKQCAGYGGALSVYFGLSAKLQLLNVTFFNLLLQSNVFANCAVSSSSLLAGNVYGGAISVYIGGYSSNHSKKGAAMAAVGDTEVRNVSITLENVEFTSCCTTNSNNGSAGANAYGGSFSFYVGAYAWSYSEDANSSSLCGTTTASGVRVSVSNAPSSNCSAVTMNSGGSFGANSYGGSMSVVYIGAYAWSSGNAAFSSSVCGTTTASDVIASVSNSSSLNCSAVTMTSEGGSGGASSYGGSMSVVYVGAYAWSLSFLANSSSLCGTTTASGLSVSVSNASSSNCSAVTMNIGGQSLGANSYGGSMSVVYIGAYAWSYSDAALSSSACGATTASGVSVSVSNASSSNCSAVTMASGHQSLGASSYGGSMSVLYVGAYAWSYSSAAFSSSVCGTTTASGVSVVVSNVPSSNCIAATMTSRGVCLGANSYGGSMSVVYIGAYSWSSSPHSFSSSACGTTTASGVRVSVSNAPSSNCSAVTMNSGGSYGANSYGGSMSVVYIGAYAWSHSDAALSSSSACGTTTASGVSVSVSNAPSSNCSAVTTTSGGSSSGANSYGGSMSVVYIGSYAWSYSEDANSSSTCGTTTASGVSVSVSNAPSSNCSAVTTTSAGDSFGANSYGGSMSVVYIGAYARSVSNSAVSSSACGATIASGLSVNISSAPSVNCSAVTMTSGGTSAGASSYGGSMSVVYVGAFAWSFCMNAAGKRSSSICGTTTASVVSVSVSNASSSNCSAVTMNIGGQSLGANSYGGSMSVVYIGAYAWSRSNADLSSSACGATTASGVSVNVSNAPSFNCSALTINSGGQSQGANSYGGSMSVVYIGAYLWSASNAVFSSSVCGTTTASGVIVHVSNASSSNCSAVTMASRALSSGANSYGGSMSVVYIGAYAMSLTTGAYDVLCASFCDATRATGLFISISNSTFSNSLALSRKLCCVTWRSIELILFQTSEASNSSLGGSNVSLLSAMLDRCCAAQSFVIQSRCAGVWRCHQRDDWLLCVVANWIWQFQRDSSRHALHRLWCGHVGHFNNQQCCSIDRIW
jgi:hypothetical protein